MLRVLRVAGLIIFAAILWTAVSTTVHAKPARKAPPWAEFCSAACASQPVDAPDGAAARAKWEQCKSCRCSESLGSLPAPEEFSCDGSNAKPITVFRKSGSGVVPVKPGESSPCLNPALLGDVTEPCLTDSKLGQFENEEGSLFKFICRKKDKRATAKSYGDWGMIGFNPKTGATCFWDDVDGTTTAAKVADVRLFPLSEAEKSERSLASVAKRTRDFSSQMRAINGKGCVGCHDNGPFVWTPYLGFESGGVKNAWPLKPGASSETDTSGTPYKLVTPTGLVGVGSRASGLEILELKAMSVACPEIPAGATEAPTINKTCAGACHRLTSAASCSTFLESIKGDLRARHQEAAPASSFTAQYWMGTTRLSKDEHLKKVGPMLKAFEACCAEPKLGTSSHKVRGLGEVSCTWGAINDD